MVDIYKNEFRIFYFDEDITRSEGHRQRLKRNGYQFLSFNSRGLMLEALKQEPPHILMLFYQPLNIKFRELIDQVKEISSEIEIVVLGAKDFWPGIKSLLDKGVADDYWSWPLAGDEELEMRLDRVIEKTIFKFLAEQKSEKTAAIIRDIEELKQKSQAAVEVEAADQRALEVFDFQKASESQIIEEFINSLKANHSGSEFIYFKNYKAKNQLLVTRTSFSGDNYFRGQSIPFSAERMLEDKQEVFSRIRTTIEETFSVEEFAMQPVELGSNFFGMIMAVNFEDTKYLQKNARILAMGLRNFFLENSAQDIEIDNNLEIKVSKAQLPLVLSSEVSRARRLKTPLSLIVAQIDYAGEQDKEFQASLRLIENALRSYDIASVLSDKQLAIALPHCSYEDAAIKAETIRRQLIARGLKTQNTPLRLCFGVSEFPSLSPDSDALMADAQRACSQVLVSGKNKVCLYTSPEGFAPEFKVTEAEA